MGLRHRRFAEWFLRLLIHCLIISLCDKKKIEAREGKCKNNRSKRNLVTLLHKIMHHLKLRNKKSRETIKGRFLQSEISNVSNLVGVHDNNLLPICSCSRQQFQFLTTTSWLKELKIWQLRVFVKTNDLKKSRRKWQAEYIILGRQRLIAFANWHYWNEAPSIPNKSMKYAKKPRYHPAYFKLILIKIVLLF